MISLGEVLKKSSGFLSEHQVPSSRRQAEEILSYCLDIPRIDLYLQFDRPLSEQELVKIRACLKRRAKREPIQYIEGFVEFYHCRIQVSPSALIPRPETELLVDKVAQKLKAKGVKEKHLLDLCTGSGCIAIALKKQFPELKVTAVDLSREALSLAKQNAELNQVEIEWVQSDLFNALESTFDFLISNPPYIAESVYQSLDPEVFQYEPKMALSSGETGLEIYERIFLDLKNNLKAKGLAWFEMGFNQKKSIEELALKYNLPKPFFEKDYSDKDRFFSLELE